MSYPQFCVFEAIKHGDVERAKKNYETLKSQGVFSLNPLGRTPLYVSVILENTELVDYFVKDTSQLEVRDEKALTPLLWLSRQTIVDKKTYYHIAQSLINAKADVNASDEDGRTPLFYAARNEHLNLIELLIKAGADPHVRDIRGMSILHEACFRSKLETVQVLINLFPNLEIRDNYGRTPLHYAILASREIVEFLLDRGASADVMDVLGQTPRYYASHMGKDNIEGLLIEKEHSL